MQRRGGHLGLVLVLVCCAATALAQKVTVSGSNLGSPTVWQARAELPSSGRWKVMLTFKAKQLEGLSGNVEVTVSDFEGSPQKRIDVSKRQANRSGFKATVGTYVFLRGPADIILTGTDQEPTFVLKRSGNLPGSEATTTDRPLPEVPEFNPEGPVVKCPPDVTVNTSPDKSTATGTWPRPTLENGNADTTIVESPARGTTFPFGSTAVTVTATARNGASNVCVFFVHVVDVQPPTLTCPKDVRSNTGDANNPTVPVSWTPPRVVDNVDASGAIRVQSTFKPNDRFPIGRSIVVYNATDSSGNENVCFFSVFVTDNTPPRISCPPNVIAFTDPGEKFGRTSWRRPTVSDNSRLPVTLFSSFEPGQQTAELGLTPFNIGETIVDYTATDIAGNKAACQFSILVIDREPPAIQCPGDLLNIQQPSGERDVAVSWASPVVSDNSGSTVAVDVSRASGSLFGPGRTTVTATARDAAGNENTCSFIVQVVDREAPVLRCPPDIVVPTTPGRATAVATWEEPTITDNSNRDVQIKQTQISGQSVFRLGPTVVTYTATDRSSNEASCSFRVTVVDREPPAITCPPNVRLTTDAGRAVATYRRPQVVVADNLPSNQLNLQVSKPLEDTYPIGSTVVRATVADAAANQNACSFTVTVVDEEKPKVTCPSDVVIPTAPGLATAVAQWNFVQATDNSGGQLQVRQTRVSGLDVFNVGSTTVTYTVSDPAGNEQACSFQVTVVDAEAPKITCPDDVEVATARGTNRATITVPLPRLSDNLGQPGITLTSSRTPEATFVLGNRRVQYTARDVAGNEASCSFRVIVVDREPPRFVFCPANVQANKTLGRSVEVGVATWQEPRVEDNSERPVSVTQTRSSGENFPLGDTVVRYTATDESGNQAECVFTVTIVVAQIRIGGVVTFAKSLEPAPATLSLVPRLPPPEPELRSCEEASVLCQPQCGPAPKCTCPQDLVQQTFPGDDGCPQCRCGCPNVFNTCVCGAGLEPSYFLTASQCLGCRCGPFCTPANCQPCADGSLPRQFFDANGCRRCSCAGIGRRSLERQRRDAAMLNRIRRVDTNADGSYEVTIDADPGEYSLIVVSNGIEVDVDVAVTGIDLLIDAAVPEIQSPDEWQIITTWVRDNLPSHNDFNSMIGTRLPSCPLLYFGQDTCFDDDGRFLFLNKNFRNNAPDNGSSARRGAGPETVTIVGPRAVYDHVVYGYERVSSFIGSQAQVNVYNADGLVAKLHVSLDAGDQSAQAAGFRFWHTFTIDTLTGITPINVLRRNLPPSVTPADNGWQNA